MAPTTATPPGLQEATRISTAHWQDDLQALFDHAKDRFADVVWELQSDDAKPGEEIWGHKGMFLFIPVCFLGQSFTLARTDLCS